jgi:hypothetical protein
MLKKTQVVMLPTNEKAINVLTLNKNYPSENANTLKIRTISPWFDSFTVNKWINQHLYILSDEEIKEGDWIYHHLDGKIVFCDKEHFDILQGCTDKTKYGYKKIIATTDTKLGYISNKEILQYDQRSKIEGWHKGFIPLPQPSQSFIQRYIEKYNENEQITEVMVECETYFLTDYDTPIYLREGGVYRETNVALGWTYEAARQAGFKEYSKLKVDKNNTITIKPIKDSWSRDEVLKIIDQTWGYKNESIQTKQEWIEKNL